MRFLGIGMLAIFCTAASPPDAVATPFEITRGHLDWNTGFSVGGANFAWEGEGFSRFGSCSGFALETSCFSGDLYIYPEFGIYESTLTVDGIGYHDPAECCINSPEVDGATYWNLHFSSPPPTFSDWFEWPETLIYTSDFEAQGGFSAGAPDSFQAEFQGSGVATLFLTKSDISPDPIIGHVPGWAVSSAHLEFNPVPEPNTVVLGIVGFATAGLYKVCRRRTRRTRHAKIRA
jgi:hypothetical protein